MRSSGFGRRKWLKIVGGGAAAWLAHGKETLAEPLAPEHDGAKETLRYRVIDIHCHPRWVGHNGARMIENMNAAGIERAWLLSWDVPEREMSPESSRP